MSVLLPRVFKNVLEVKLLDYRIPFVCYYDVHWSGYAGATGVAPDIRDIRREQTNGTRNASAIFVRELKGVLGDGARCMGWSSEMPSCGGSVVLKFIILDGGMPTLPDVYVTSAVHSPFSVYLKIDELTDGEGVIAQVTYARDWLPGSAVSVGDIVRGRTGIIGTTGKIYECTTAVAVANSATADLANFKLITSHVNNTLDGSFAIFNNIEIDGKQRQHTPITTQARAYGVTYPREAGKSFGQFHINLYEDNAETFISVLGIEGDLLRAKGHLFVFEISEWVDD